MSNERDFPDYIKINKLVHVTLTKKEETRNELDQVNSANLLFEF